MNMIRRNPIFQALVLCLLLPAFIWLPQSVRSNPQDGIVIDGEFEIFDEGGTLMIEQFSDRGIIEWESFSISGGERTVFNMPGEHSAALNRVTGGSVSQIDGALQANGTVWLINQNGIVVGPGGNIDVFGFMASTLDVSNDAFMGGGDVTFSGPSLAPVQHFGTITAAGGDVVLAGHTVQSHGTIGAVDGFVGLAGGNSVLYKTSGDQRIFISAGEGSSVTHTGEIRSAAAELRTHGNAGALAIRNDGIIRATGAANINGRVVLQSNQGNIVNTGEIYASNFDGSGGTIELQTGAGEIHISNKIWASGTGRGGDVRVIADLINVTETADVRADGDTGGSINLQANNMLEVKPGAKVTANGATGDGGNVDVQSFGDIVLYGNSTIAGNGEARGGSVNIAANGTILSDGAIAANGATGDGGLVAVSATDVMMSASGSINANGGNNGGTVRMAATEQLIIGGTISGRGGEGRGGIMSFTGEDILVSETGNIDAGGKSGGTISMSATEELFIAGQVSAVGDDGQGGNIFLRATDVIIAPTGVVDASGSDGGGNIGLTATDTATIHGSVLATGGDGAGGTITVNATDLVVGPTGLIDASGASGGTVRLSATDSAEIFGTVKAVGNNGAGGNVFVNAADVLVGPTATIDAGGSTDGGAVRIAARDTAEILGTVRATGGSGVGGTIGVTGSEVLIGPSANIDASGGAGGGTISLGGGYQGGDPNLQNAQNTNVADGAQIRANAINSGDGGDVFVWADGATDFAGAIQSLGANGGAGGFAEVSGKQQLTYNGLVRAGQLLLDPTDVTLDAAMATALRATLEGGTDTLIQTNFGTGGAGNVTVASDLRYGSDADFAIFAQGAINATASIQNHGAGNITLAAGWTPGADGLTFGAGPSTAAPAMPELNFANINGGAFGTFGASVGDIRIGSTSREVEIGSAAGETNLIGNNITLHASGNREDQTQVGYRRTRRFVNDGVDPGLDGVYGTGDDGVLGAGLDLSAREIEVSGNINIDAAGNMIMQVRQDANPARQPVIVGHGGQSFGAWAQQRETLTGKGDSFNSAAVWKDYTVLGYIDNSVIAGAGINDATGSNAGTSGISVAAAAAGFDGDLRDLIIDGVAGGDSGDVAFNGDTLITAQNVQQYSGDINIDVGNSLLMIGGDEDSFVHIGHVYQGEYVGEGSNINNLRDAGGMALINMEGDINVNANLIGMVAGWAGDSRAQIGHGGRNVRGVFAGDINVTGETGVVGTGNTRPNFGGGLDYVMIGHGGYLTRQPYALPGLPGSANNAGIQRIQINNDNGGAAFGTGDSNLLPNNYALHMDFVFGNYDADGGNVSANAAYGVANVSNPNFVSLYDPDGDGVTDVLPADAADFTGNAANGGPLASRDNLIRDNPGGFRNVRQAGGDPTALTIENQFDGGRDPGDPINRIPHDIVVNGTTILQQGERIGNRGDITVRAPSGTVSLEAGVNTRDWALIGHGGDESAGAHEGDITVIAGGATNPATGREFVGNVEIVHRSTRITAEGSTINNASWSNGERNFAQIGHGGFWSTGSHAGDITITATGNFNLEGGTRRAWAQLGHGGWENDDGNRSAQGTISGDIIVNVGGNVVGRAGFYGNENWVQIGHGGARIEALAFEGHNGNISVNAGGMVDMFAGNPRGNTYGETPWKWARIGHGGTNSRGDHWGDIQVSGADGVYVVATAGYDGWMDDTDNDGGRAGQNDAAFQNGRVQPGYGRADDRWYRNALSRSWADGGYAQVGHGGWDAGHLDQSGSEAVGFGVLGRMADRNSNLDDRDEFGNPIAGGANVAVLAASDPNFVGSSVSVFAGIDPLTGAVTNPNANFALVGASHGEVMSAAAIDRIHTNTFLPTLSSYLNDPNAPSYVLNVVPQGLKGHVGTLNAFVIMNEIRDQGQSRLLPLPPGFDFNDPTTWTAAALNALSGGRIGEMAQNGDLSGRQGEIASGAITTPTIGLNRLIIDGIATNTGVAITNGTDSNISGDANGHAIDLDGDNIADVFIIGFPDPPAGHPLAGTVDAANVAPGARGVGDLRLGTPLPYANGAFAQIGHGGRSSRIDDRTFYNNWTRTVKQANTGVLGADEWIGGGHTGDISIDAAGSISLIGSDVERVLYGETNNGGNNSSTNNNHRNGAQNPAAHWNQADPNENYLMVGHGGQSAFGVHSGNISLNAGQDLTMINGASIRSSSRIGHGGWDNDGGGGRFQNENDPNARPYILEGDISLTATRGNVVLSGDPAYSPGLNSRSRYITGNRSTADLGIDGGHNNLISGLATVFQPGGELNNSGVANVFAPVFAGASPLNANGLLDPWTRDGSQNFATMGRNRGVAVIDMSLPVGTAVGQRYHPDNLRIFDGRFDGGAQGGGEIQPGFNAAENTRYAEIQVGHGGALTEMDGFEGNIDITSGGRIDLRGGVGLGDNYALIGHGGYAARTESTIGNITLTSGTNASAASGDINIIAGDGRRAAAQVGHGGWDADAQNNDRGVDTQLRSGNIVIHAGVSSVDWSIINPNSSVNLQGGNGDYFSEWRQQAQFLGTAERHVAGLGNGAGGVNPGVGADNDNDNGRELRDWTGNAGSGDAWAQIGHNGRSTRGTAVGNIIVRAANEATVIGGDGFTSRRNVDGQSQDGPGGGNQGFRNHDFLFNESGGNPARIGHGGWDADGNFFGNIEVTAYNDVTVRAGAFERSYAQVGHGGGAIANGWNYRDGNRNEGNGFFPNDRPVISGDVTVASYRGNVTVEGSTGIERNDFDFGEMANALQFQRYLGHPAQSQYAFALIGHGGYDFDVREDISDGLQILAVNHDAGLNFLPTAQGVLKDRLYFRQFFNMDNNAGVQDINTGGGTATTDGVPDNPRNGMTQAEAVAKNNALLARHLSLGNLTANINVTSGLDTFVLGGTVERDAFAQIGNGGIHSDVLSTDGNVEVRVGRDLVVQRGSMRGRSGDGIDAMGVITDATLALGSLRGNTFVGGADVSRTAPLNIGAAGAYAQVAGAGFDGTAGAGGGIPLAAGEGSAYQAGGGVIPAAGGANLYADVASSQFNINNAYAKIGHGQHRYAEDANGIVGTGTPEREHRDVNLDDGFRDNGNDRRTPSGNNSVWDGNVIVAVGQDATFAGAMVGQKDLFTANVSHGSVQTNTGDTIVGVGREDATGSAGILTADAVSIFTSAENGINGALRFYAPTRQNLAIAAGTRLNGSLYPGVPPLAAPQRGDEYLIYPDFTFVAGAHGEPTGDFIQSNPYPVLNAIGLFYDINLNDLQTLVPGANPFVPGGPPMTAGPMVGGPGVPEGTFEEEERRRVEEIVQVIIPEIQEETIPIVIPFDPTALLFDIFEFNYPSFELFDSADGAVGTGTADGGEVVYVYDPVTRRYRPIRSGGGVQLNPIPFGTTGSPYNSQTVAGEGFPGSDPNFIVETGEDGTITIDLQNNGISLEALQNGGGPSGGPTVPNANTNTEEEDDEEEEEGDGFGDLFNEGGGEATGDGLNTDGFEGFGDGPDMQN